MSSVDESGNVSLSGNKTNVDRALKDKRWEEVQIKAFTSWLNSLLSPRGLEVNDLTTDLADGLRLVGLCEVTTNKILRGIDKKPMIPIQKINNINIALNSLRNDLHVRLDMIGAEDVFGGNLKMILGMIFATFRKVVHSKIGMLTGSGENESQEVGLLKWIREQTNGYEGVHITDFKNSFNDGLAFNALVHRFDKNLFDYDSIDKNDKAENLKRAFVLAEKHLGVPQLLDVNEILSGDADERSIILYSSLYFHAFVSNEERLKAMGLQETLSTQIEDTKTRLQTAESELLAAREDNSALLARLAKLEEQLQFYARARASDQEAMDLLSTKVNVLGGLLEEEKNVRSAAEEARYRLQQEIEELTGKLQKTEKLSESEIEEYRKRLELLREQEERERRELEQARQKIAETSADFQRELEQMERRKNELAEQIANLRKSVADEKAVRKQREAEVQQLRSEVSKLRAASIPQAKARNGLALLKRNLEEHLEDMYKWRELHHGQTEENRFDLAAVISQTANKTFDETLVYLDDKLAEENRSLLRIVSLSDNQIQDRIEKEGVLRMKFRKDWSKRYFRVVGNKISWYAEDGQGRREGSVDLSKSCEIVRQKALKSDEAGISKFWPLKLTVVLQVKQVVDGTETLVDQEKKLFIRAASKKERHSWFSLISGKIASLNYRQALEGKANPRPDTRILNFLAHSDDAELFLDGRAISDEGILAVTKVIPGHDQLTTISISNAQLSSHAVTTFAEALVKSQAVVSVALSKNNIQSEPGVNLVTRLASLERITDIHLDDNQLGAEVGQALASSLPQLKALKTLNLNGNNLGVAGAGALASSLAQNPIPLTSLQLARNHIQDAAASPIAAYLSHNESVTSVDLSGNELTDAGVAALADGLAHNHSVRILDLSNNKIGAAGAAAIKHLLSSNKLIDEIRLANNNLSASQVEALTFSGFAFKDLTLHRSA